MTPKALELSRQWQSTTSPGRSSRASCRATSKPTSPSPWLPLLLPQLPPPLAAVLALLGLPHRLVPAADELVLLSPLLLGECLLLLEAAAAEGGSARQPSGGCRAAQRTISGCGGEVPAVLPTTSRLSSRQAADSTARLAAVVSAGSAAERRRASQGPGGSIGCMGGGPPQSKRCSRARPASAAGKVGCCWVLAKQSRVS